MSLRPLCWLFVLSTLFARRRSMLIEYCSFSLCSYAIIPGFWTVSMVNLLTMTVTSVSLTLRSLGVSDQYRMYLEQLKLHARTLTDH